VGRVLKLDAFVYPVKKCEMEKYCIYCSNYVEKFRIEPLSLEEFFKAIDFIKDCGMRRVTLEGGYNKDNSRIPEFVKISRKAKLETILDIYPISLEELRVFKDLGVSEIYSSIEIADEKLFSYFKPNEKLEDRLKLAKDICEHKIGLSSTIMIGLPNMGYETWIKGLLMLRNFDFLKHIAISSFNPVYGTPLENAEPLSPVSVAKFVALARILFPEKDISAGGSVGLQSLPLMLLAGENRAYLGSYVCKVRTQKGFADEMGDIFKPEFEAKVRNGLVFANPSKAVEKICIDLGFEVD
ncbi:MAG: radical SAM protein, partial [Archaeoglobaceae archaeon]|nr:radical SAM protein [Archaeoglobaceae archaeon]MDW8117583.1 radical SAM protein [Archaeoglobaceae archaeon]